MHHIYNTKQQRQKENQGTKKKKKNNIYTRKWGRVKAKLQFRDDTMSSNATIQKINNAEYSNKSKVYLLVY